MILIVSCAFCSQGSAKSFVSPQLPYSGRRRTGDPAVPGGREPHRLVKRGKKSWVSIVSAIPEGRVRVSIMSSCSVSKVRNVAQGWVHKTCFRSRLSSLQHSHCRDLHTLHSPGEMEVQCSSETMMWCGHCWQQQCDLGLLLSLLLLL